MLTDRPPHDQVLLAAFLDSDRQGILDVPRDNRLRTPALSIESAMQHGTSAAVRAACAPFPIVASDFYRVPRPEVRVLAARPLRLDSQRFGWRNSPHTRGFCERTAALYHHAHDTPPERLCCIRMPGGRWRIDWRRTNRGS
jgi:hypothetical protein